MYKLTIILLFISTAIYAQETTDFITVDSLSYNYFQNENWDKLIALNKEAENNKINFKYLQQRIGYAYFMKSDYFKAIKHYNKSLEFDKNDEISHLYLYYSALNIGDQSMAQFHLSKLPLEKRESLQEKSFKLISAVDFEYSYKFANYETRSNPDYIRIGLNTKLGYRLNLYQSISRYNQIRDYITVIKQDEYFGLLSYALFDRTTINLGYHYVNTNLIIDPDTYVYPGNIFFGKFTQKINRFDFAVKSSVFNSSLAKSNQLGMEIGYVVPSKVHLYLKSSLVGVNDSIGNRLVFSQNAGLFALKNIWVEGSVTLGNLNNYVDANGLYFYNSIDQTTFRSGLSAFWYLNKHFIIYTNYTYDNKLIIDTQDNYKQHSITGGIIWKI